MKNRSERYARIARIIFLMEQAGAPRLSLLAQPRESTLSVVEGAGRVFKFIQPQFRKPIILGR